MLYVYEGSLTTMVNATFAPFGANVIFVSQPRAEARGQVPAPLRGLVGIRQRWIFTETLLRAKILSSGLHKNDSVPNTKMTPSPKMFTKMNPSLKMFSMNPRPRMPTGTSALPDSSSACFE